MFAKPLKKKTPPIEPFVWKKLVCCARCEGTHLNVTFTPFTIPFEDDAKTNWTLWAPCPTNGEPIFMSRSEDNVCPPTKPAKQP